MAKRRKLKEAEEIETDPGAWDRFEHAVDAAVGKGGPGPILPHISERPTALLPGARSPHWGSGPGVSS